VAPLVMPLVSSRTDNSREPSRRVLSRIWHGDGAAGDALEKRFWLVVIPVYPVRPGRWPSRVLQTRYQRAAFAPLADDGEVTIVVFHDAVVGDMKLNSPLTPHSRHPETAPPRGVPFQERHPVGRVRQIAHKPFVVVGPVVDEALASWSRSGRPQKKRNTLVPT